MATWSFSLSFAASYSVSPYLVTPLFASPRRPFFCRTWYSWLAGCLSSRRKSKSFRLGRPSRTLVLLVPDGNSSASVSIHRAGIELECCSKKQAGGCRRLVLSISVSLPPFSSSILPYHSAEHLFPFSSFCFVLSSSLRAFVRSLAIPDFATVYLTPVYW